MKFFLILHRWIICFSLMLFLQTSTVQQCNAFSIGDEREMGEQLLYQIRLAFPLLDDPDIFQYINDLGNEVLGVAGVQYFEYHFNIIHSDQFNAFAAPSGLIFFYSGLIEKMNHEDELVSVLAHEIGHVVSRHIAEGMDRSGKITLATSLLALASLALGVGALSQALLTGALASGQAANLYFSREAEEEADLLAYGWMKKMNRHPRGQEAMLNTMRRITRYTMGNNVPQYLLTHPHPSARLDYIQSLMAYEKKQLEALKKTDDFAFLRTKYRILSLTKDGRTLRNLYMSSLAKAEDTGVEHIMLQYALSQLDRMENNLDSSRERLRKVIQYFPKQPILLVDLGIVEMEAGGVTKALSLIEKAYKLDNNDMWATFQLARVWMSLGSHEKAEKYLQEVERRTPLYSKVYYQLGKLKAARGEPGEASYYLGKFYLYEGKFRLARHSLEAAFKKSDLRKEHREEIVQMGALMDRLEE